ncbi:MAG: methyltransferase domain-containing protein [Scytolyngbya sp. HA4215-MV1]|nr:methyltransferase domain-containing protein [Scytolyngbya sp. HA4215-MV1]
MKAVKLSRQFVRPPFPQNTDNTINLHLGCGSIQHPKFINIDARPASHIHYVRPIDNLSPFKDNSVDLIYACHCLEHFSHTQTHRVLAEWYRVLKKDGILRISVPDFDLLLNIYADLKYDLEPVMGLMMGGQNYEFNFHKAVFNAKNLTNALLKVGFKEVQIWQPGKCEMTTFDDWSGRYLGRKYPVSLNLEAMKVGNK